MPPLPDKLRCDLKSVENVFDTEHYAGNWLRRIKRSLQLAPRYYLCDLPRYLQHRRDRGLSIWDWESLWNPFREFPPRMTARLEIPERLQGAFTLLSEAGVRLTLPPVRVLGLSAAWWATRQLPGDIIECGVYRGATSLLLALLGRLHGISQKVLMLDTFRGVDEISAHDVSRGQCDYPTGENQVEAIRSQAEALGIADRAVVYQGLFSESFATLASGDRKFALAHIDANLYDGTRQACEFVLPRVVPGGMIVFDDYYGVCDLGARLAIDEVLRPYRLRPSPLAGYSAFIRVSA